MVKALLGEPLPFWLQGDELNGGYALTRIREGDDETGLRSSSPADTPRRGATHRIR